MLSLTYHNIDTLRLSTTEIWLLRLLMVIKDKSSTLIKDLRPSKLESTTNLGTSRVQEKLLKCKSGVPIQDGGNYSDMKEDSSLTCGIIESSMFTNQRMLKPKRSLSKRDKVVRTNDGRFNILTKLPQCNQREWLVTSVSMPTDLSTSDQDSQWRELWSALVPIILLLEDGEITLRPSNGISIQSPRQLDLNNGRIVPLKFKAMVEVQIWELLLLSIQDGGRCLECKELSSQMNVARLLMFKEELIQKIETLLFTINTEKSTNNGTLSMLMNGRENQQRVNWMKISVFMLRETSMLLLSYPLTDILT